MTVATLQVDVRLNPAGSSRAVRKQIQAIMDKLHSHFNVSVAGAEVSRPGEPGLATFVVAAAACSRREARETLERVADALASHPRAEILRNELSEA